MAKRNPKWDREMKKAVEAAGCEFIRAGKHYKIMRDGLFVSQCPCSPSDHRALKNLQSTLRQRGVDIKVPTP
jgi:hypothetical protein